MSLRAKAVVTTFFSVLATALYDVPRNKYRAFATIADEGGVCDDLFILLMGKPVAVLHAVEQIGVAELFREL